MQLLTEGEASQILKCTKAALRRWRRERRGPPFVRLGRMIRYRESDIEAFIQRNTEGVIPEKMVASQFSA